MNLLAVSRRRAFAVHLAITLAALLLPIWLVVYRWYPGFFLFTDGGIKGLQLLIGVQLIVGPLLTLVLFKPEKRGLLSDLILIGTLQIVCLVAGTWVLHAERPLFLVFYEGDFYSTNADTYERYGVDVPDPEAFAEQSPATVIALPPDNPIEEQGFRVILYKSNLPLWAYPRIYRPFAEHKATAVEAGIPPDKLHQWDEAGTLNAWLADHGGELSDYAFIRIVGRFQKDIPLAIRKSDGRIVGTVGINLPPKEPPRLRLPLP